MYIDYSYIHIISICSEFRGVRRDTPRNVEQPSLPKPITPINDPDTQDHVQSAMASLTTLARHLFVFVAFNISSISSIYLSIYLSIYQSINLSIYLSRPSKSYKAGTSGNIVLLSSRLTPQKCPPLSPVRFHGFPWASDAKMPPVLHSTSALLQCQVIL